MSSDLADRLVPSLPRAAPAEAGITAVRSTAVPSSASIRDARIVMCGCHDVGGHLIGDLIESGVPFSHFVTLTPEQGQRHDIAGYHDLSQLARSHDIPVYNPQSYSLKDERDLAFFREQNFDLLIQGGWQRLFPESVLQTLRVGAIGAHGSADFLPKGRGRSPLNWSLIEGRTRFLLHLFLIKPGADDGDVLDVEDYDINAWDDIRTLYYKMAIAEKRMIKRSLAGLLEGTLPLRPQRGEPSHYARRTPDDGRIDWENMDVRQLYDFIRAQTRPYPGAFGFLDGKEYRIWKAQVFDTRLTYPDAAYGEVVECFDGQPIVNCRGGLLLLTDFELLVDC